MRPTLKFFFLLLCLLVNGALLAQDKKFVPILKHPRPGPADTVKADTTAQLDMYDAFSKWFGNENFSRRADSVGLKPVLSVVPAIGYTLQSKLALTLAGNVAFRTSPGTRVSTIIVNTAYTQTHQVIIPVQSSIWTNDNDYNFVGDIRYLKYPESTWGLGTNSELRDEDPMDYSFFRFYQVVLRRIFPDFFFGAGYIMDYHFNITEKGPLDGAVSGYRRYGASSSSMSSGVTINTLFDSRDNSINASRGFYAAITYRENKTFLGSTTPWQSMILDIRKYVRFPAKSGNTLAFWSYDWLVTKGRPPYLDLPSTTWDTFSGTGRGYIQGRFRGAGMLYFETEYRFGITRNGLLGGVVFANFQSFSAAPGTPFQSIQPAFGPGIRLKLNKVSKTNIAVDYGIGMEGSRGVFINVGEIF